MPKLAIVRSQAPERPTRRRPKPRPIERIGPRPDRVAGWAVALCVLMLLAALLSSHG